MPVSYSLKGPLLTMNLEGRYETQEIIDRFRAAMADPLCPSTVSLLLDVTRSESLERRAPHEIRLVAESLGPFRERIGGRCAIVAERDVHFGLSNMGSAYTEGIGVETAVFRDIEGALGWLGVPVGS